mmetsp:Transcript_6788/g.16918  ORF Transcript_6788/g.16918 Transcript_6788/m.16918 type:complete len:270 (-) Transcript_6788:1013-1822(-)
MGASLLYSLCPSSGRSPGAAVRGAAYHAHHAEAWMRATASRLYSLPSNSAHTRCTTSPASNPAACSSRRSQAATMSRMPASSSRSSARSLRSGPHRATTTSRTTARGTPEMVGCAPPAPCCCCCGGAGSSAGSASVASGASRSLTSLLSSMPMSSLAMTSRTRAAHTPPSTCADTCASGSGASVATSTRPRRPRLCTMPATALRWVMPCAALDARPMRARLPSGLSTPASASPCARTCAVRAAAAAARRASASDTRPSCSSSSGSSTGP